MAHEYPATLNRPLADLAVSATPAYSAALSHKFLRLCPNVDIRYVQYHPDDAPPDPSAAAAGVDLGAGQVEYVNHTPGWKIAVVRAGSDDGNLNICHAS